MKKSYLIYYKMIKALNQQFENNLETLQKEIESYKNEGAIWKVEKGILNSGGNLCLHICGNLRHFIGHVLGHSSYERDREAEFESKDIPREKLIRIIEKTKAEVSSAINSLDPETLTYEYPLQILGKPMSKEFFLLHLLGHFGYHLGQINYHRRLLDD